MLELLNNHVRADITVKPRCNTGRRKKNFEARFALNNEARYIEVRL